MEKILRLIPGVTADTASAAWRLGHITQRNYTASSFKLSLNPASVNLHCFRKAGPAILSVLGPPTSIHGALHAFLMGEFQIEFAA
jgi:hypothetical protein